MILKLLFISILGLIIPYISGMIAYESYSSSVLIIVFCYFIFVSYCIWQGCHVLHIKLGRLYGLSLNPFNKKGAICISSSICVGIIACIFGLLWMKFSLYKFHWLPLCRFIHFPFMAAVLFKLVYEIIYLSNERVRDNIIVDQLDNELNRIDVLSLRNAIKHTQFTQSDPLQISISMDKYYLTVESAFKKKSANNSSTKISHKNLNAQYRLILEKSIIVERLEKKFEVKLPLFKNGLAV